MGRLKLNGGNNVLKPCFSMDGKVCVHHWRFPAVLGYYMARGFLEAGAARVYITARKAAACIEAAEELSQYGECNALPGDMSEDG